MKKTYFLAFIFTLFLASQSFSQSALQPGTICLKHPAADNSAAFFSGSLVYQFEVFQVGSNENLSRIIAAFQKENDVESITVGTLTGDYQAFHLTLKKQKNKDWFATTFRKAGLNTIRINRRDIVTVDKM